MTAVRVQGSNRYLVGVRGGTLLDVLEDALVAITSECGGTGRCGLCRVRVIEGAASLGAVRAIEREHLGRDADAGDRLACQSFIVGSDEVVVCVPDSREILTPAR